MVLDNDADANSSRSKPYGGYICEWETGTIDMTDNDNDGLPDELEESGMVVQNGQVIYTDPNNPDCDGDGLKDGEEILIGFNDNCMYFVMKSNPNMLDEDKDGIPDLEDPYPHKKYDSRFYVSDNYSVVPKCKFVEERWKQSEECYHSISPDIKDWIASIALIEALYVGDALAYLPLPSSCAWSKLQAGTWTWSNLTNAANMLRYYLCNQYSEVGLSSNSVKDIISCHKNNMLHFKYNLSQLMNAAEETTLNSTKVLCTTNDSYFRTVCMVDRTAGCELAGEMVDGEKHPIAICELTTGKQADWNLAIGSSYGGMVAEVVSNGDNYTMRYKYYINDIYEWAAHDDDPDELSLIMHRLHEIGLCHQYLITGYFEGELSWEKGQTISDIEIAEQIQMTFENPDTDLDDDK